LIGRHFLPAEVRSIRLPTGEAVETPLLVPSFSSKGFGRFNEGDRVRSEVSPLLDVFHDQLAVTYLVSAYDLHHGLLQAGETIADADWAANTLSHPALLFVDSGGYEVTQGADAGEPVQDLSEALQWSPHMYGELLDRLPEAAVNCAAVAWDLPGEPYESQIAAAQEFLGARPRVAPIILLKPPSEKRWHNFSLLASTVSKLAFFSVVGVTEHELGDSLLDRVIAVIELRALLHQAGIEKPIHIFGALDPLFVPLYFAAGADVFDGLTWLRYAYWHGLAVHHEQGPLLTRSTEQREDVRRATVAAGNLTQLGQLHSRMLRFVKEDGDWTLYDNPLVGRADEKISDILQSAYLSAVARRRT
jgi:hypothetical protein